jgi:hypothetical protein
MKKFLLMILTTIFIAFNANAFDEINGNKIVLLTSAERKALNDSMEYESVTEQRAENACKLIGKSLKSFTYREVKQDYFADKCPEDAKDWCITHREIQTIYKIPTKSTLLPVNEYDMETHYHRGGATVAILSLGFIPIIIPYPARIATSIECQDIGEIRFTTN